MADRSKKLGCLKYFMMSSNAFGVMIGIFLVLFGLAYPEEKFPGGYQGKETAGIAGVFIFFTLIGYCGAHRSSIYFLILYSIIILLFITGNLALWLFQPESSPLDPESRTVYAVSSLFLVLMVVGVFLSWQIRRAAQPSSPHESATAAGNVGQQQQLQHQQMQQQMTTFGKNNNTVTMHPSSSTSFVQMVATPRQTQQIQLQVQQQGLNLSGPIGQNLGTFH